MKVYQKPTHLERYLQFDSHHPVEHKSVVARTLFSRVTKICSNSNEQNIKEKQVFKALRNNGYPRKFLREVCNKGNSTQNITKASIESEGSNGLVILPYIKDTTEQLKRVMQA